ncbi:potassium channel subfamily K member 13-like [Acipenser ruthenus]|uniref:potassium channel subfamily K member 13-like n=1 Tax=Acipenser ruthenus TaxID=7906 RepID=UPI00274173DB|nr:potassium channel subfamily K member 13-like [Acipenser ruthenus]
MAPPFSGSRGAPPGFRDLRLNEENARFALLALLMAGYLLCGAAVFSAIEHPAELENHRRWNRTLLSFTQRFNISPGEFRRFLREYEVAMARGIRVDALRPRWDFAGAFYFVGTVVSTIGFGMTTPSTITGKIFLIFYGMMGCAGTILFFNLFLERVITLLAVLMKGFRRGSLCLRGGDPETDPGQEEGGGGEPGQLSAWKPSVYNVMLILGLAASLIAFCASSLYTPAEGWSYVDSLYFCFVAFSTIGFGDLVSGQRGSYENQALYGLGNFSFMLLGVCCLYSLFNVISIVIKQFLNWLLSCCCFCSRHQRRAGKQQRVLGGRRHRVAPLPASAGLHPTRSDVSVDTEAALESETDARRVSVEMSAIRDFLANNNRAMATDAPRLPGPEAANGHLRVAWGDGVEGAAGNEDHRELEKGLLRDIGSLAIMNNKLAETSDRCGNGLPVVGSARLLLLQQETSDHRLLLHRHWLSSAQGSPASESRSRRAFPGSPASLGVSDTTDGQGGPSSGVGSLANLESLDQTSGSQNGLSSSRVESPTPLNRRLGDNERASSSLDQPGDYRRKMTKRLSHSGHGLTRCVPSPVVPGRRVGRSGAVEPPRESLSSGGPAGMKTRVCSPRDTLLSGVGSLAVMNDRFAETSKRKISRHQQRTTETQENT